MRYNALLLFVAGAALLLAASSMSAQSKTDVPLGQAGQVAISSDLAFSLNYSDLKMEGVHYKTTLFTLAPAADYFVADRVSVGGAIPITYRKDQAEDESKDTWGVGLAPRVGYLIPLAENVGLWPKLGFAFSWASTSPGGDSESSDTKAFDVGLFAPFVFRPASHFFIGVGPTFDYVAWSEISRGGESIDGPTGFSVGFATQIGGYF